MALSQASSYLLTIEELSQKQSVSDEVAPIGPLLSSPFIIVGALACTLLLFFIASKLRVIKHSLSTLILIGFAVSIPYVLSVVRQGLDTQTKASPQTTPQHIQIQKLSDTSVSVSWNTQYPTRGALRYNGTFAFGSRDKQIHHEITLSNLTPHELYSMEILSDAIWYDNNGQPLQFILP